MRIKNSYYIIFILAFLIFNPALLFGYDDLFLKLGIQPIKNSKAPNFCLKDLNGNKVELNNFKGNLVMLTFWATWCASCKNEMPSLEDLYRRFNHKNFSFFAISVDYEKSNLVAEFIKKHGYTFPVLIDQKNVTINLFKINGIPTTIIIDKKGMIIGKAVGQRDWNKSEVLLLLNNLLEK